MRHTRLASYPAGLASSPARTLDTIAITHWITDWLSAGNKLYLPELIDYELRRELLRAGKTASFVKKASILFTTATVEPVAS